MERTIPKRINIHLGAHKTATTYIQKVLRANKEALSVHGIKYIAMQNVRKNITERIRGQPKRGVSRLSAVQGIREYIDEKYTAEHNVLVISDENIIGSCREIYRTSELYPKAVSRLQLISDALHAYEVNVYFCVREYVDFFPSAYCEYLRHNDFLTFEDFLDGIYLGKEYWVRVVSDIIAVFGKTNTHIWSYEKFRKHVGRVIAEIIASSDVTLSYDIGGARPSMSNLSVRALYKLNEVLAPAETRKLVGAVTTAFPKGEGYDGYSPWNYKQSLYWANKYKTELDIIKQLDGVFMDLD